MPQKTIEFFLKRTQGEKWDVTVIAKDTDSIPPIPLTGVLLKIIETGASGLTGIDGIYIFKDVPTGLYQMSAEKEGYDSQVKPFELKEPPK